MFLPPDQRAVPPRWEPPGPPKRKGDPASIPIVPIATGALLAPIGGGLRHAPELRARISAEWGA